MSLGERPPPAPGERLDTGIVASHVAVHGDGTVSLKSGKVDLGQGITTALAQIAADELGVSLDRVRVVHTDTDHSPNERYTSGSYSVEKGGTALRLAAAEVRSRLLELATVRLDVPADVLVVRDGTVSGPDGASVTYWALAGGDGEADDRLEPDPTVGTSTPRWDLPGKFRGERAFVHDLVLPGMLHGRVVRPPAPRARLTAFGPGRVEALPGVVRMVRSGSFLGVVAEREEQADRAARRISVDATWEADGTDPAPALRHAPAEVTTAADRGVSAHAEPTVTASFSRPFLAHGSIGPSCAVALLDDGRLTVWTHSQGVFPLRADLAGVLGLSEDQVRVIHLEGAGCYGHNGADDAALDAALLARAVPGRPVRVQWSRADEFAWEPYGSAMEIDVAASLDDHGLIASWRQDVWSHTHNARPGSVDGSALLAATHLDPPGPAPVVRDGAYPPGGGLRNAVPLYDVPNLRVTGHFVRDSPVRTSALRSLGSHGNLFAIEATMDELAAAAGADPVEFRLRHLSDPRARAVIESVVERAAAPVGGQDQSGHGYGLAFGRYKNTGCYVAVIAEVEAEEEVRLVRAWATVDAGLIVNPDGACNQIEGGIIQAASWTLKEQVTIDANGSATRSWLDYPILTFRETPDIDVELLHRPEHPSVGVGEGAQGPTTGAIANGLRAALGVTVRDLPFTPARVMKAILG